MKRKRKGSGRNQKLLRKKMLYFFQINKSTEWGKQTFRLVKVKPVEVKIWCHLPDFNVVGNEAQIWEPTFPMGFKCACCLVCLCPCPPSPVLCLQGFWLLPHHSEQLLPHMEAYCSSGAQVVLFCKSHHAADSLLHPGHAHPPVAAGTHRPNDGKRPK